MIFRGRQQLIIFLLIQCFSLFAQKNVDDALALQYFQNGEFEKAADIYEKLYEKKPQIIYYDAYIKSLIALNDLQKAEKFIKKQIKSKPNNPRFTVDLGYLLQLEGNANKAQVYLDGLIKKTLDDEESITNLANAFLYRDMQDYAILCYQKGLKANPKSATLVYALAELYEKKKDYEKMMNEYVGLIEVNANIRTDLEVILQNHINDDLDGGKSKALKQVLLRKSQKSPDNILYAELLFWLSMQLKDFETAFNQAKALDRRQNAQGYQVFDLGKTCLLNESYDVAIKCFEYIISKGKDNYNYINARLELLNTKFSKYAQSFNIHQQELKQLELQYIDMLNEMGESAITIPLMLQLAKIQGLYLNKQQQAIELLKKTLTFSGVPLNIQAECKLALADMYLFTNEVWEATLLYSQVEKAFKHDPLGHNAKLKNAKLSFYIGEFEWAKAQLDVLKAATSKLIANDAMELYLLISDNVTEDSSYVPLQYYATADLLTYQHKYDEAIAYLDSIPFLFLAHPILDEALYKKAQIYYELGDYNKVDTLLKSIIAIYAHDILADDALFQLAELYEVQFKNKTKAMEYYQDLLVNYPGSIYTIEARKKYRILRGDFIN